MRRAWAGLTLLLALAGCALGQPIAQQAVDYNHAVETAANTLLLHNILRARDERPLHFTTMPQIRGSLSVGLGQPGIGLPVGALAANGLNLGIGAANSPSFDVSVLDTQDFIRGLLEPLESGIVRYYWDRGIPEELLLMLLFSSVEEPETGRRVQTDPRCWVERDDCPTGPGSAGAMTAALDATLTRGRPIFHSYTALVPLGGPQTTLQLGETGALALATEGKLRLMPTAGGRFQPYRLEPRVANCRRVQYRGHQVLVTMGTVTPEGMARGNDPTCYRDEVVEPPVISGAVSGARAQQVFVRSVQEIIRFLGQMVLVQSELPVRADGAPACIAFNVVRGPQPRRACLFQLLPGAGTGATVTVEYGGRPFHVPPFTEATETRTGDYSMRVLALVADLVNLKKSSTSIPSTRAVQIVR